MSRPPRPLDSLIVSAHAVFAFLVEANRTSGSESDTNTRCALEEAEDLVTALRRYQEETP